MMLILTICPSLIISYRLLGAMSRRKRSAAASASARKNSDYVPFTNSDDESGERGRDKENLHSPSPEKKKQARGGEPSSAADAQVKPRRGRPPKRSSSITSTSSIGSSSSTSAAITTSDTEVAGPTKPTAPWKITIVRGQGGFTILDRAYLEATADQDCSDDDIDASDRDGDDDDQDDSSDEEGGAKKRASK